MGEKSASWVTSKQTHKELRKDKRRNYDAS